MTHQESRRKDKLIARSQRIAFGVHFIEENAREQAAPSKALPLIRNSFLI